MKKTFYISTFFIVLITQFLFINPTKSTPVAFAVNGWNNWYGIAWSKIPVDNIKYAKQRGYNYIAIQGCTKESSSYLGNPELANMNYFAVNPQFWAFYQFGSNHVIAIPGNYKQAQKNFIIKT